MEPRVVCSQQKQQINMAPGVAGMEIRGVGVALPSWRVSNAEAVQIMLPYLTPAERQTTVPEWIEQRTKITERRVLRKGEKLLPYIVLAAKRALETAGMDAADVDMIVVATVTPQDHWPTDAAIVAAELGIAPAGCDVTAACSSFMYAWQYAYALIRSGLAKNVLLLAHDAMSLTADPTQRSLFPLFGDAATAMVLTATAPADDHVVYLDMGQLPQFRHLIGSGEVSANLREDDSLAYNQGLRHVWMVGDPVFKQAVTLIKKKVAEAMRRTGLRPEDFSLVAPHQANGRITESALEGLKSSTYGLTFQDWQINYNVARYGNTTSASILLGIVEAWLRPLVDPGAHRLLPESHVLTVSFGGGFTYGVGITEWSFHHPEPEDVPWAAEVAEDMFSHLRVAA